MGERLESVLGAAFWVEWRRRVLAGEAPEVSVVVRSALPVKRAVRVLRQAVRDALVRSETDEEWAVAATPFGAVLRITKADRPDVLLAAVEEVLRERGVTGRIERFLPQRPDLPDDVPVLECRLRLRGRLDRRERHPRWLVDELALEAAATAAQAWCDGLEGAGPEVYLRVDQIGFRLDLAGDPDRLLREIVRGARSDSLGEPKVTPTPARLTRVAPDAFRSAAIDVWSGRLTLVAADAALGERWPAILDRLRDAMIAAAPSSVYGLIKRGRAYFYAESGSSVAYDWLPIPHFHAAYGRESWVEQRYAPDAFGIQLLGRGYQDRIPADPGWTRTPVGSDSVLLEHHDPAAWYAEPRPDPALLAQARSDLAAILTSDELIEAARDEPTDGPSR